jgi:trans-aconitate 2-methyltransferase
MLREWDATTYNEVAEAQFGWGLRVLERVDVLGLRGDETLLDAGCGTGRITAELLRRVPRGHVVALDLSENMLRVARQTLTSFGQRVSLIGADLQHLPFDTIFDGIFSSATFHRVPDHDRLFAELYRALKPGGWVVAQCGGGPNLAGFRAALAKTVDSDAYRQFFRDYSPPWHYESADTTAMRLRAAGFSGLNIGEQPEPSYFQDDEAFKKYLVTITLNEHVRRLPPELLDRFLSDVIHAWGKGNTLDYWRLNIQARKP